MKITWFARTCFRLHIGGKMLVIDPEAAPEGVDAQELVSGADRALGLGQTDLPAFDAQSFRPRRRQSLIDAPEGDELGVWSFGETGLVIEAADEPLVVLAPYGPTQWGRFADDALVVLQTARIDDAEAFTELARKARPRLVALASDTVADGVFATIGAASEGIAVQMLDPGLALEV